MPVVRRPIESKRPVWQRTSGKIGLALVCCLVVIAQQTDLLNSDVPLVSLTTLFEALETSYNCSLPISERPSNCSGDDMETAQSSAPTGTKCEQIDDQCTCIQCQSWSGSWNSVNETSKKDWYDMDCRAKLRKPLLESSTDGPNCKLTKPNVTKSHERIGGLQDKYKDGKCVLIGNGPSLNKMRWDWQEHFDVIMGTNKIYLGFERYNLTMLNFYASCNDLVMKQARDEIWGGLGGSHVEKFLRSMPWLFPCSSASSTADRGLHFIKSGSRDPFSIDPRKGLNEGWTVTYWSLEVLYFIGCKEVYIIGIDHNFQQSGKPNEKNKMTGDDPNHFDPSYFKGNNWHNADLEKSEKHYKIADDFFKANGRKIYDATPGGKCEIFEKVDWTKALYHPS